MYAFLPRATIAIATVLLLAGAFYPAASMSPSMTASLVCRAAVAGGVLALLWRGARSTADALAPSTDRDLRLLATALVAATAIVVTGIVLGSAGVLHDYTWGPALLLAAWALPRIPWVRGSEGVAASPALPPVSFAFAVAVMALAVGRLVFGLRNPPADWDSLRYHIPMVAHWIVSGTLGVPLRQPSAFGSFFPGSSELLQALGALVLHRETLMTWPAIACLPFLALTVRRLALQCGAGVHAAELAGLALVATECAVRLTLGTRIDLLLALWTALSLLFLAEALRTRSAGAMCLALFAGALIAGSKANGPFLLVLLLVIFAIGRRRESLALLRAQRASLPVALLLALFWFARNGLGTGNPLFPVALRVGLLRLPGLDDGIDLARTTQAAVWREGYAGHLAPRHVLANFGVTASLLACAGLLAGALNRWLPSAGDEQARDTRLRLSLFAVVSFAVFLFSPFSGAYMEARGDMPPMLNPDNLRYLFPTLVAAVAVGAAALPRGRVGTVTAAVLALLALFPLRPFVGHVVPGLVLALVGVAGWRRLALARRLTPPRAVALSILLAAGVGLAAAGVEESRARVVDGIWDGYRWRDHNLTAADVRRVTEAAARRPFGVVGVNAWSNYYGPDLSARPVHVPFDRTWRQATSSWSFLPDLRERPDHERWLRNLAESRVPILVVGWDPADRDKPPEWDWCLADTAHFRPMLGSGTDRAYEVRDLR